MDRKKVESARDYLRELVSKGKLDALTLGHVSLVSRLLTTALYDQPDSDPGDECKCEGCKTTESAPHEAQRQESNVECMCNDCFATRDESDFPPDPTNEDFGPCGLLEIKPVQFTFHADQPSDYEIRLKAWNIALAFEFKSADCEFSATLDAATKLYNFLSGQNEDTK